MRNSKVVCIDVSFEARVNYLVNEYGKFTKEELFAATNRIGKRLGGLQLKQAIEAIEQNVLKTACEISLSYYDKTYSFGLNQRSKEKIIHLEFAELNEKEIAEKLIKEL